MSLSTLITPAILDKVISLLVPLFLTSAGGDLLTAQHAVSRLLADYDVETEEELRLAAEIISFGFGALDALSQSMAPDLTMNAVLRLRGSANTQHRSGNQCQRTLDKLRKQRQQAEGRAQPVASEPVLQKPTVAEMQTLTGFTQAAPQTTPAACLSRQQRRETQRRTEKAQRKQAERIRRQAMHLIRTTAVAPLVTPPQSRPADHSPAA